MWVVETESCLRFLCCGYNECCRYVELSSCELIGGKLNWILNELLKGYWEGLGWNFVLLKSLPITACPFWAYQQYTPTQGQGKGHACV